MTILTYIQDSVLSSALPDGMFNANTARKYFMGKVSIVWQQCHSLCTIPHNERYKNYKYREVADWGETLFSKIAISTSKNCHIPI